MIKYFILIMTFLVGQVKSDKSSNAVFVPGCFVAKTLEDSVEYFLIVPSAIYLSDFYVNNDDFKVYGIDKKLTPLSEEEMKFVEESIALGKKIFLRENEVKQGKIHPALLKK